MFISPAYAQTANSIGGNETLVNLVPFIIVMVIMYFLLIRPQMRKAKSHQEMVKSLRRGDSVIMTSGMIGKITKVVDDNEIEVEIGENVKVRFLKVMVSEVRNKPEPVQS